MPDFVDVIIIGAGPYGLSLAAHLHAKGVDFRIFGRRMESWRDCMPPGMRLKSHAWSSSLSDPLSEQTFPAFCKKKRIPIQDADTPSLEQFVAYAEAFQEHMAPNLEAKMVRCLRLDKNRFRAELDDGEVVIAKRVVVAVGVHPFKYIPDGLLRLPKAVLSHSSEHGSLDEFAGRTIAVIGAGASATDLAGLLLEKGASVSLIARSAELKFAEKPRAQRSAARRMLSVLKPLLRPGSGIGAGWMLKFCADAPALFHKLPQRIRTQIVDSQLGPLGHSEMKERIIGKIPLYLGHELSTAEFVDGEVDLQLRSGEHRESLRVNHVIAATGYKVDTNRLDFLDQRLLSQIAAVQGAPVLSENYEASVPGLYFIGPAAANAFGPVMRFVFGAYHPSRRVSAHLSKQNASHKSAVLRSRVDRQVEG